MPKPIPDRQKIIDTIKEPFKERYKGMLGDRYDEFIDYSFSFLRRSIRVNTLKTNVNDCVTNLSEKWQLKQIPWCDEGFWVEGERRDIGNTTEHVLGNIYVQEAASMIPPIVLDPKPGMTIIDMAAAPGSKTSQIAAMMKNEGVLVANDISPDRLKPLGLNLQRCGITNAVTTIGVGQRFREPVFDKILLDAPCSGTGTIRKSLKTVLMWNPAMVKRLSITQKDLIQRAFNLLKPNGEMVYSTCSLEPQENEEVIDFLLSKNPNAEMMDAKIKGLVISPKIMEFEDKKFTSEVEKAIRIWPQDNDTEGFFVAKIKKS